jgi:hypothetical protein
MEKIASPSERPRLCVLVFCLLLFGCIFLSAHAEETERKWTSYAEDEKGVKYFFDKEAMSGPTAEVIKVWKRRVFPRKSAQQEIITLDEINCRKQQYRTVELHVKNWDNSTEEFKKPSRWITIYRGYPEEYFLEEFCP